MKKVFVFLTFNPTWRTAWVSLRNAYFKMTWQQCGIATDHLKIIKVATALLDLELSKSYAAEADALRVADHHNDDKLLEIILTSSTTFSQEERPMHTFVWQTIDLTNVTLSRWRPAGRRSASRFSCWHKCRCPAIVWRSLHWCGAFFVTCYNNKQDSRRTLRSSNHNPPPNVSRRRRCCPLRRANEPVYRTSVTQLKNCDATAYIAMLA